MATRKKKPKPQPRKVFGPGTFPDGTPISRVPRKRRKPKKMPPRDARGKFVSPTSPEGKRLLEKPLPKKKRPKKKKGPRKRRKLPQRGPDGRFIKAAPPAAEIPDEVIDDYLAQFWGRWLGPTAAIRTYVFPSGGYVSEGRLRTDFASYIFQIAVLSETYPPIPPPDGMFQAAVLFEPTDPTVIPTTELLDYRRGGGFKNVNQQAKTTNITGVSAILAGQTQLTTSAIAFTEDAEGLLPSELIYRIRGIR